MLGECASSLGVRAWLLEATLSACEMYAGSQLTAFIGGRLRWQWQVATGWLTWELRLYTLQIRLSRVGCYNTSTYMYTSTPAPPVPVPVPVPVLVPVYRRLAGVGVTC